MDKKVKIFFTVVVIAALASITFVLFMIPPKEAAEDLPNMGEVGDPVTKEEGAETKDDPILLNTKYIESVDWPPKVQIIEEPFSCTEAGEETARAGETTERDINGRKYCVTKVSRGAAGSIYTQYAYAGTINSRTVILTFSLRFPQCGNYIEPEISACENERLGFDIDKIIDAIFQNIVIMD